MEKIRRMDIPVSLFIEPDFGDELTSICFLEQEETKKLTAHLPTSLRNYVKEKEVCHV